MAAVRSSASLLSQFDPQLLAALSGLDLKARYLVEGFLQGLHESPFHGISVEFSEYREYQPGDDLRHLDWRLYARCDRPYVKRYTQETNVRVYLVCDTSASMAYGGGEAWGSKLDVARAAASALCLLMLGQNDAVGLLSTAPGTRGAEYIRPSQKPSQFGVILHHLDQLQPAGGSQLADLLAHAVRLMHRRSMVLFFSDLLEPAEELASALAQLRFLGHECLIFQVLDRDETEFPFAAEALFEDLETGVRRTVLPAAARERYLERFGAFRERHREQFRTLEMPYCLLQTHEAPWAALALFLAERRRLL